MYESVIPANEYYSIIPSVYGYADCESGHSYGPHVRPYYLMHYILDGKGVFEWENGKEIAEKGDLFIIHPGEITTYTADLKSPWEYAWLAFYAKDIKFLDIRHIIKNAPVGHIFTQLKDMHSQPDSPLRAVSLMHELIWRLSLISPTQKPDYAQYAKAYIDANFMKQFTIEGIAADLHINRHYLCALFNEKYGVSPQKYLTDLRLEKSREFLMEGYGVTRSAMLSGFNDLANFSKKYKAHYGISPIKNIKK